MTTLEILKRAKACAPSLAQAETQQKNNALLAMADALEAQTEEILQANAIDMEKAQGKLSQSMLDRLALTADRIRGMAAGIRQVVELPDPVGAVRNRVTRENGIVIDRVGVPMGVVAALIQRLKQIKGGEEDAAAQY